MKPEVSVILVEYRGLDDLKDCFRSIEKHLLKQIDAEVIVISNSGLCQVDRSKVRDQFGGIRWIFNDENMGFAKAVNQGLLVSEGRYVMPLNPDARLLEGDFAKLLCYLDEHQEVGIAGVRMVDREGRIEDSYRAFMSPGQLVWRLMSGTSGGRRAFREEVEKENGIRIVDWVSGACMIVRREAIEDVGPMDEGYFLYVEDMDWCKRFWDRGWQVVYWPEIALEHTGKRISSRSLRSGRINRYVCYHARGYVRYLFKHYFLRHASIGGVQLKRSLDIFLATIGLCLSAPIWGLIGLGIKLNDGGPVFYAQERVGQGGRLFKGWKFRSMITDSDARFGPLQASDGDPRVTWIGRLLRATALDELPQLWNILTGDMSFVGPRALLPDEIEVNGNGELIRLEKIPGYEARHRVRPGLTGLAQVYAPRDILRRQKFRYDLLYIKKQSLWLDIKLILLSVWISVRGKWEARTRKF